MRLETRRGMFRRGAAVAAGSVAAGAFPELAEARTGKVAGTGYVAAVRDGAVRLDGAAQWITTRGFPDSWEIRVGDRVGVLSSAVSGCGEMVAEPLVHWETAVVTENGLVPARGAAPMQVDAATVYSPRTATTARPGQGSVVRVQVVDHAPGSGPDRIMAIRPS